MKAFLVMLVVLVFLSACSSRDLRTTQEDELRWRSESRLLPAESGRYQMTQTLPAGTEVTTRAPRKLLDIEALGATQQIERRRIYTDSNGLPLIELPIEPSAAADEILEAIDTLGWTVRRTRFADSYIEIDGSEWLERRTDRIFNRRPRIEIYFYALGNGTQVHMQRSDESRSFPVSTQRELLEKLYAELP